MNEIWKDIPDYPDYQASNLGRIRSLKRKEPYILIPQDCSSIDRHQKVKISENGKANRKFVHRLVLLAFNPIDNPENFQVNHIDGNPLNNKLENLEWVTPKENYAHYKKVLIPKRKENDTFSVGVKPIPIKITFENGNINYYLGQKDAAEKLNISRSTFTRWINEPPKEILKIEQVDKIPENYQNKKIEIKKRSVPVKIKVSFYDKEPLYFDNGKQADDVLGLSKGTILRWQKLINKEKKPNKLNELKIKNIEKI